MSIHRLHLSNKICRIHKTWRSCKCQSGNFFLSHHIRMSLVIVILFLQECQRLLILSRLLSWWLLSDYGIFVFVNTFTAWVKVSRSVGSCFWIWISWWILGVCMLIRIMDYLLFIWLVWLVQECLMTLLFGNKELPVLLVQSFKWPLIDLSFLSRYWFLWHLKTTNYTLSTIWEMIWGPRSILNLLYLSLNNRWLHSCSSGLFLRCLLLWKRWITMACILKSTISLLCD